VRAQRPSFPIPRLPVVISGTWCSEATQPVGLRALVSKQAIDAPCRQPFYRWAGRTQRVDAQNTYLLAHRQRASPEPPPYSLLPFPSHGPSPAFTPTVCAPAQSVPSVPRPKPPQPWSSQNPSSTEVFLFLLFLHVYRRYGSGLSLFICVDVSFSDERNR